MNKITQTHRESREEFVKALGNFVMTADTWASYLTSQNINLLEAVIEEVERKTISDKGTIQFTFADGTKHEIDAQSDRAIFYNTALSEVKQTILSAIKEIR